MSHAKCAGDEEKMLILYFNRVNWSSLPTTEKESFVKKGSAKKGLILSVTLISFFKKIGFIFFHSRSIIEKLGHERISKLKIVGDKEMEQSLYGQLVFGKIFSSGVDEELAKEAMKAVSAEKQRIAEEVASMLKLNIEIDTTSSESLQKIIAA
ncbi:hypothetical protein M0R45_013904 [Rubus argutus]|uniref:Uncharacterized protein n=1 Tax=Rubus argutus TaxID=59490 RepID=A0AAW1XKN6_RUBAR